jgi:hypothetical protein
LALVIGSVFALGGCSKSGTRVRAEIWPTEVTDAQGAQPQLLDPAEKPFVSPLPGRTIIALTPGIYASVAGNTELTIQDVRINEDGNETSPAAMTLRKADLQLASGELCAYLLADETGGNSAITVSAPGATISAEAGTLFLARATPAELRVTCVRGSVQIDAGSVHRAVDAGDYLAVPQDNTALAVSAGSAGADASAQTDVDVALDEEGKIRDLVREHALSPASWMRR